MSALSRPFFCSLTPQIKIYFLAVDQMQIALSGLYISVSSLQDARAYFVVRFSFFPFDFESS
jgi:hypothetical protein